MKPHSVAYKSTELYDRLTANDATCTVHDGIYRYALYEFGCDIDNGL